MALHLHFPVLPSSHSFLTQICFLVERVSQNLDSLELCQSLFPRQDFATQVTISKVV